MGNPYLATYILVFYIRAMGEIHCCAVWRNIARPIVKLGIDVTLYKLWCVPHAALALLCHVYIGEVCASVGVYLFAFGRGTCAGKINSACIFAQCRSKVIIA